MTFENEKTFLRMQKQGKEKEFHELYDKALIEAKKYIGKEYPNIILSEEKEGKTFDDISPMDGESVAKFQASSPATIEWK